MKIGDYETAEVALREFIDKNKDHDLAGSAQYWYGETFRINIFRRSHCIFRWLSELSKSKSA